MSRIARDWALAAMRRRDLPPSAKLVLVCLADRHNQETGNCSPAIRRIATDAGISESSVKAALRQLKNARLIKVFQRTAKTGRGKPNMTNMYVLIGGAITAPKRGRNLPPNREDIKTPSAPYDLAMTLEGDDDV